jgi:2-phosphosulfolactate phosphatase
MNIQILKGLEAAKDAVGICVVIDVFRATTTIPCLLESNPNKVILAPDRKSLDFFVGKEGVFVFTDHKDYSPRFDNSPSTALNMDLTGSDVVISTMNGTHAMAAASHCDTVIAGSFINMNAVVDFIVEKAPESVSLLAIGHIDNGREAIEDTVCAEIYDEVLAGLAVNQRKVDDQMQKAIAVRAKEFSQQIVPEPLMKDFMLCLDIGRVNTVPVVEYGDFISCVNAL